MQFLFLLIFCLLGAVLYRYFNHRHSFWAGFMDFVKEFLYTFDLYHPYLNTSFVLSYEQAELLAESFSDLLMHPVLLDFEINELRGWMRFRVGFLDWKTCFKEYNRSERLAKLRTLITFFYRTKKGVRISKTELFFMALDNTGVEFMIPLNASGQKELLEQMSNHYFM